MFQFISILKGFTEIVLLCLVGQGILFVFTGENRQQNGVYRIFSYINKPAIKLTRWLAPKLIVDQHLGLVAFFLFGLLWILLVAAKIYVFVQFRQAGVQLR